MQLIQTWPEELRATHDGLMREGGQRLRDGDFIGAAEVFDAAFRLVLDAQPEGRRYHKGESLHNKGMALVFAGRGDEAVRETLAAFVEDAASLAEENPRFEELARPAAHNLVYVFGLAGPALAQFARHVRMSITSGDPLADPHSRLGTAVAIEAGQAPSGLTATGQPEGKRSSKRSMTFGRPYAGRSCPPSSGSSQPSRALSPHFPAHGLEHLSG